MDHTVLPAINTMPRKRSPDGASTDWGGEHLIAAHHSVLMHRPRKDERLSWPSWLVFSGRFTHIVVTRQLKVERRTGSVRRPKTGVPPPVLRNQPSVISVLVWHHSTWLNATAQDETRHWLTDAVRPCGHPAHLQTRVKISSYRKQFNHLALRTFSFSKFNKHWIDMNTSVIGKSAYFPTICRDNLQMI